MIHLDVKKYPRKSSGWSSRFGNTVERVIADKIHLPPLNPMAQAFAVKVTVTRTAALIIAA